MSNPQPEARKQKRRPDASSPAASPRDDRPLKSPFDAFTGEVPRHGFSFFYTLGLLVVAGAMILLPLIYLGLIGLVGYAVYYHAVENAHILTDPGIDHGRARIWRLLVYAAPLVAGPLLIFFLFKPLLAKPAQQEQPLTLDRTQEPTLYALLDRLCLAMGAPAPRQIEVDCQVNAAAGFRRGWISLLTGDLTLVLGLPLAASMNVEQFVGVVAHEFGHFSQSLGMRLGYVIRSIDAWFARVIYERDQWDQWLVETSRNTDARLAIILLLTRLCVWLSRRVLWILMMIGHALSCGMARQMEYDADRRACEIVGSKTYAQVIHELHLLGASWAKAISELEESWKARRLADNLPVMVSTRRTQVPPALAAHIFSAMAKEKTRLFATHPSAGARLARIAKLEAPGAFHWTAPAISLFANFKMISHAVTLSFYRDVVGLKVDAQNLIPTEQQVAEAQAVADEFAALERYTQRCFTPVRPLRLKLESIGAPENPRQTAARLKNARAKFEQAAPGYRRIYLAYQKADKRQESLAGAATLLAAGFRRLRKEDFELKTGSLKEIETETTQARQQMEKNSAKMDLFDQLLRTRLTAALSLAMLPALSQKSAIVRAGRPKLASLLAALERLEETDSLMPDLQRDFHCLVDLALNLGDKPDEEIYQKELRKLRSLSRDLLPRIEELRARLQTGYYPFEHAQGRVSLAQYVLPDRVLSAEPGKVGPACGKAIERVTTLRLQVLSKLASTAEEVEKLLAMKPMDPPPEEKPDEGKDASQGSS